MANIFTRTAMAVLCAFGMTACSTSSSFEWLSLASWTPYELNEVNSSAVNVYYYTSEEITDSLDLVVRESRTGRAEALNMKVVEKQEVVRSTWMGDQKCYAYRMVMSDDGAEVFQFLKDNWSRSVEIRAPKAESGLAWLIGAESEIVVSDAPLTLDDWLESSK